MVKIEFKIPPWAIERTISIFAGNELLAQKIPITIFNKDKNKHETFYDSPLKIKSSEGRCTGCGDCCSTGGSPFPQEMLAEIQFRLNDYQWQGSGTKCPLLGDNGCIMKGKIPFACLRSNCEGWSENCTEKLIDLEMI